ncbi:MAG: LuxR C-terminal-related transcriptional regulator, partial [Propionicimonas sp.]
HQIGPRAVSRTVLLRLARLDTDAGAVAAAVAVLNEGAELTAVARLAGVSEVVAGDAARALADAEILRDGTPLAFVHPLVRDAVYHELAQSERARRHSAAAGILRDLGAGDERTAAQLLLSPPAGQQWAVDLLRAAAGSAVRSGAPESAAAYLRRAVEELPAAADRGQLLYELGSAEALVSGRDAVPHLREAYELQVDPEARAATAGLLCRLLLFTDSAEAASSFARRAIEELPEELVDLRRGLSAFEYMTGYFGGGDPIRLAELRQYRTLDEPLPGARHLLAMAAWEAVCSDGAAEEASGIALRALSDDLVRATDPTLIWFAATNTIVFSDRPEALPIYEAALAEAYRRGSLFTVSAINMWLGYAKYLQGDLAAGEEMLRAAIEGYTVWGYNNQAVDTARCFLASLLYERGQLDEALEVFDRVGATDPGENTSSWWAATRASLLLGLGRAEEALPITYAMEARAAVGADSSRLWWRVMRAAALARLGRRDEALELALEDLAVNRAFGAPAHLGRSLRVVGVLTGGDEGLAHRREAVEVLESSCHRLELCQALEAYGAALRRARRPLEAREPLLRALDLASACGVEPMAARVRAELQAAGARPRRDAISGMDSLTPSERRVVELAAAGRANRDIAQDLYVTPKTVEVHLSSAYRKLGIRSRGELGGVLAAAG